MASKSEALSATIERVQRSVQKLPAAAADLNQDSDQLSKSVAELDTILKGFSLGVPTWTSFWTWESGLNYEKHEVGYAKISSRWGVAIRIEKGNEVDGDTHTEQWLFNEAPRLMRVRAVDAVPDLLEKLISEAGSLAAEIREKAGNLDAMTAGIRDISEAKIPRPNSASELMKAISVGPEQQIRATLETETKKASELMKAISIGPEQQIRAALETETRKASELMKGISVGQKDQMEVYRAVLQGGKKGAK